MFRLQTTARRIMDGTIFRKGLLATAICILLVSTFLVTGPISEGRVKQSKGRIAASRPGHALALKKVSKEATSSIMGSAPRRRYFLPPCDPYNPCPWPCSSPIIIDLANDGFDLTDVDAGVKFDLMAEGFLRPVAWTAENSDDSLLCYDRNGNGRIDDGAELFGNRTPQPPSVNPNGFLALAVFDLPDNGGNRDGMINKHDAIYSSLRLWRDVNHNGISEPGELSTLASAGIKAINLNYKESQRYDLLGNLFRYRSKIVSRNARAGRWAVDVFLHVGID